MGSVTPYETAKGRRYRVRYRKPDKSQTDKRGFKTKRDAELYLASVTVSKARGEYLDHSLGRVTISALGAAWLERQSHLKPSTRHSVESTWRVHVEPRWSSEAVSSIQHTAVQSWVSELSRSRSATTVKRAHGILLAILADALRDKIISSNAASEVKLPKKTKRQHGYLTHEQVDLLAMAAGDHGMIVRLLAYTGLRWGEATGLRVRDVDTLRRRLHVRQNAVYVGGQIHVGTPKTDEQRWVPYPRFLERPIARWCEGKPRDGVLLGDGTSHLRPPNATNGWFAGARKRAGAADPDLPRVTLHDLRHTAASLAISAGANVKAVQRMLGHASAAMTLDVYADLFDDDLESVAAALDEARDKADVGRLWAAHLEERA